MLWRVADTEMRLLGAVHLMDGPPALSPSMEQAYRGATRIAFEARLDSTIDLSCTVFSDRARLSQSVPPALFAATRECWLSVGLPEKELEVSRPWWAALRLQFALAAKHGLLPEHGVDQCVWTRSANDNAQVVALEPAESALYALASGSADEQAAFLGSVVMDPDAAIKLLHVLIDAWRTAHYEVIDLILTEALRTYPQMFGQLIFERNRRWMPQLLAMVRDRVPTFVVVGALHFSGEFGLPALFAQQGLQLSQG
jgi:uncharacterized protein YbaP (TraB family)